MYTVKAFRLPACAAQHCPFAAIPGEDAGTLVVGTSTGLLSHMPRAGSSSAFSVPSAFFQGERIHLMLNGESDGAWRADLLTPTGIILKHFQFSIGPASIVGLDAGPELERGFYLLRVLGPTGEIHILPIVRKD